MKTQAMKLGTAIHKAILEPDKFEKEYAILPEGDGRKKEIKEAREKAIVLYGENCLSPADYGAIINMSKAFHSHAFCEKIHSELSSIETTLIWEDPNTNLKCKARVDGIAKNKNYAIDLKSTVSASPDDFAKSIANYGYHRQAALYVDGMHSLGIEIKHFIFIAIEKTEPFGVGCYILSEDDLNIGRAENDYALKVWKDCTDKNSWPDYNEGKASLITLPSWAKPKFEYIAGE
jgi:exodeoxyribonuclease VIII